MTMRGEPTAPAGMDTSIVSACTELLAAITPSKVTTAPAAKPPPRMVIVPPPSVVAQAGEMLLIEGPVAATVIEGPMLAILLAAFMTLSGYVPGAMDGKRSRTRG